MSNRGYMTVSDKRLIADLLEAFAAADADHAAAVLFEIERRLARNPRCAGCGVELPGASATMTCMNCTQESKEAQ